jgi:hypothetical protein
MSTRKLVVPAPTAPVAPDAAVVASMTAHAEDVKAKQATARKSSTKVAPKAPRIASEASNARSDVAFQIARLRTQRDAITAQIRELQGVKASTPRATLAKADPKVVAAFFASTGMTRKQIAAAVGVSTSVIATVQSENGDRWSQQRFDLAKPLILAAAKKNAKAAK